MELFIGIFGLISYHFITMIGVSLNSIIFYKLGFKKSIKVTTNIDQNDLLKNIKEGKSSYSLLYKKKGIILTREPFDVFNFSNQFLKLRTIFYISDGSIKADIFYDPFGFILSLIWIILFSIIPLGIISVNDDIY